MPRQEPKKEAMLDAFIIEEIKRKEREEQEKRDRERPRKDIPEYPPEEPPKDDENPNKKKDDRGTGGKVIILN